MKMKRSKAVCALMVFIILMFVGVYFGDAYRRTNDVVSIPCLGCMGMKPVGRASEDFINGEGIAHPDFVKRSLNEGIVILHYRTDICPACDAMEPVVRDLEDSYRDVIFIHINLDHADEGKKGSYHTYDIKGSTEKPTGVPMFVILTKKDNEIYFLTLYGIISKQKFSGYIDEALEMYEGEKRNVFAEHFTDTQCVNCPKSEHALKKTNIVFISLISDIPLNISRIIKERESSYGVPGHPTVVFDGGVEKIIGAKSEESALNEYEYVKKKLEKGENKIEFESHWTSTKNFVDGRINATSHERIKCSVEAYLYEKQSRYRDVEGNPIPNGVLAMIYSEDLIIDGKKEIDVYWEDEEGVLADMNVGNAFVAVVFYVNNSADAVSTFPLEIRGNFSVSMQDELSVPKTGTKINASLKSHIKYERDVEVVWEAPDYISINGSNRTHLNGFEEKNMEFFLQPHSNAPLMETFYIKFRFKVDDDLFVKSIRCTVKEETEPPGILSVSYTPKKPKASDKIDIACKISDQSEVNNVKIVYFVCTETICEINITASMIKDGDEWHAEVGPFDPKYESLHYKIIASDKWNNTMESEEYEIKFIKEEKQPIPSLTLPFLIWVVMLILIKRKMSRYFVNGRFMSGPDAKTCNGARWDLGKTGV